MEVCRKEKTFSQLWRFNVFYGTINTRYISVTTPPKLAIPAAVSMISELTDKGGKFVMANFHHKKLDFKCSIDKPINKVVYKTRIVISN
jgi:hypothetical protein